MTAPTIELASTSYTDASGNEYHFWAMTSGDMVVMEILDWDLGPEEISGIRRGPIVKSTYAGQRLRNRLEVKASHTEWVWLVHSVTGGIHPALVDTAERGKIWFVGPQHKRATS